MTANSLPYAVVLHSAFGYAGDRTFSGALETRAVNTKAQRGKVEKAGGVIFDNYCAAEDFCDWAMYTASNCQSLIPQAQRIGKFAKAKLDKLQIFMPSQGVVEAFKADPHAALPAGLLRNKEVT